MLGIGGITIFVAACFILLYFPVIGSFFAFVKIGISIQLVAIANLNVTPATLLDFSATAQNMIGFPIRVGGFVFYVGHLMKRSVQAFIHMIVQCALRCCATCIGTILNKC